MSSWWSFTLATPLFRREAAEGLLSVSPIQSPRSPCSAWSGTDWGLWSPLLLPSSAPPPHTHTCHITVHPMALLNGNLNRISIVSTSRGHRMERGSPNSQEPIQFAVWPCLVKAMGPLQVSEGPCHTVFWGECVWSQAPSKESYLALSGSPTKPGVGKMFL